MKEKQRISVILTGKEMSNKLQTLYEDTLCWRDDLWVKFVATLIEAMTLVSPLVREFSDSLFFSQ